MLILRKVMRKKTENSAFQAVFGKFPACPKNFFVFYQALIDRGVALTCSGLTGEFRLDTDREKRQLRKDALAKSMELEKREQM